MPASQLCRWLSYYACPCLSCPLEFTQDVTRDVGVLGLIFTAICRGDHLLHVCCLRAHTGIGPSLPDPDAPDAPGSGSVVSRHHVGRSVDAVSPVRLMCGYVGREPLPASRVSAWLWR